MQTINYNTHPGGAARFDRHRRQPYDWTCLWCFERSPVDPMAPGRCPHCDTEFWSRHRDYGPTPASYYTSDPAADPDRLMAIVRHEEGWRWMIVRDLDGYPVCKGPPAQTERAAERHLHQFLRRVREGKLVLEDMTYDRLEM